jgi:hypothetical protein
MSAPLHIMNWLFMPKFSMVQYYNFIQNYTLIPWALFPPLFFTLHGLILLLGFTFLCQRPQKDFYAAKMTKMVQSSVGSAHKSFYFGQFFWQLPMSPTLLNCFFRGKSYANSFTTILFGQFFRKLFWLPSFIHMYLALLRWLYICTYISKQVVGFYLESYLHTPTYRS